MVLAHDLKVVSSFAGDGVYDLSTKKHGAEAIGLSPTPSLF